LPHLAKAVQIAPSRWGYIKLPWEAMSCVWGLYPHASFCQEVEVDIVSSIRLHLSWMSWGMCLEWAYGCCILFFAVAANVVKRNYL
jgi:hypothetical protein